MNRRKFISNSSALGITAMMPQPLLKTSEVELVKPRAFPKNGTLQLITPAGALKRSVFQKTMENMQALGINVKYSDNLRVSKGFVSGTDAQRLHDLHAAFQDDAVDGVWCARGGYGSGRLLPYVDFDVIRNNPKVFIGFSDITALLFGFYKKAGLVGFHGPVGASTFSEFTQNSFFDVIDKGKKIKYKNDESPSILDGQCRGRLIGGNLSLIASLIGTPFDVSFDDHILFIEEVGEATYRIDRMLTQLHNSGKLNKVRGVVLGHFTNCDTDENDPYYEFSTSLDEVFSSQFKKLGVPVAKGFPIGHEENNATLPIGLEAELDASRGLLKLLESPVV